MQPLVKNKLEPSVPIYYFMKKKKRNSNPTDVHRVGETKNGQTFPSASESVKFTRTICLLTGVWRVVRIHICDSSRDLQTNCVINFCFRLYLMLHACAAKFDVTKNLDQFWELNKA
jgi:hypothetical protein